MQFQRLGPNAQNWLAQTRHNRGEIAVRRSKTARRAELAFVKMFSPEEHPGSLPRNRVVAEAGDAREAFRSAHIAHMTALQELAESEQSY